jgi:two-component system OmpR family sensor kinase
MSSDALKASFEALQAVFDARDNALRENALLKRQLSDTQAELESFTYSVSHDLRASLRHISAFAQILDEDLSPQVDAGVASHLKTITGAAQHMGLMIDALMALSHLGRVELKTTAVAMRPLIDEARAALATEPAGRAIQWQIADDFPAVQGDAELVRQLWQHLISNAIKFTRPESEPTRIDIGWRAAEGGLCELYIKDNGAGFNSQYAGKLFQVFQRLHSATAFAGIGMGLALSRRMVERMGGSISATGEPGQGCEVRFMLLNI